MKKHLSFFAAVAMSLLALTACGDSSSVSDEPENYGHFREVLSEDDLYACTSRFEGTSVFIIDEKKSFKCEDGTWYEIDVERADEVGELIKATLKYAADDTVTSLAALPVCALSTDSSTAYVASIGGYLICLDYEWVEIDGRNIKQKPRSSSSGKVQSSSSSDNRFKGYSSGTSKSPLAPFEGDSTCNEKTDGAIKMTSDYYDYLYMCKSGAWFTIEKSTVDMMGLNDTTDGAFHAGKIENKSSVFSSFCPNPDTVFEYNMYVFEGAWREATSFELCFNKACMNSNIGDTISMGVFKYKCDSTGWRSVNVFKDSIAKADYFNSALMYGTLKDDRDEKTYKTIKIGDYTWMAENLNFSDDSLAGFDKLDGQSTVLTGDPEGNVAGRYYTFAGAMNLELRYLNYRADSTIVKKQHRGVCPSGWHVPDTSEWYNLSAAVNDNLVALKSTVGWAYYDDAENYIPTNASGFSAVSFVTSGDRYCTATQGYYSDEYMVVLFERDEEKLYFDDDLDKDYECFLRCVMNYESEEVPVEESSSSSEVLPSSSSSSDAVNPVSSDAVSPASSSAENSSVDESIPNSSSDSVEPVSSANEGNE